jgi:hypothetical protein
VLGVLGDRYLFINSGTLTTERVLGDKGEKEREGQAGKPTTILARTQIEREGGVQLFSERELNISPFVL